MRPLRCLGPVAVLLTLATARPAPGHALGAECKLRGDRVEVEAYYDDDTPARNAKVRVLDAHDNVVAEGRTDAQGKWSFPKPQPGSYQVAVDAGAGHGTKLKMTVPAGEGAPPAAISEGPRREEFTRFPWLKVTLGLGAIALFALALWLALRRSQTSRPFPLNSSSNAEPSRPQNEPSP